MEGRSASPVAEEKGKKRKRKKGKKGKKRRAQSGGSDVDDRGGGDHPPSSRATLCSLVRKPSRAAHST